jgi:hypothetical protein
MLGFVASAIVSAAVAVAIGLACKLPLVLLLPLAWAGACIGVTPYFFLLLVLEYRPQLIRRRNRN